MNNNQEISPELNKKIINTIHGALKPDIKIIFLKTFLIHVLVAFFTTSICPQLGVRGFNSGIDLSHMFLLWGEMGCDIFCGFFFTSTSVSVAIFFLSRDEIRFLKHRKSYLASLFILASIGLLLMFNSDLFIELSLLWLIGTTLGVISTIEVGSFILKRI